MTPSDAVTNWRSLADAVRPRTMAYVNGGFVASRDSGRFETINPATQGVIASLPIGCAADVDDAVRSARQAFEDRRWRNLPLQRRKAVLLKIADLIDAHADELALLDSLEMGKAISNARTEVVLSSSVFRYFAEGMDKIYGTVAPSDPGTLAFSLFEPRGVVGAIIPWNFPLANAATKVAPALAAGNTIVLKPSEIASLSALRMAELASEAGLPDGVFNVVPGLGDPAGVAIARHNDIDFLTFTGSTATGRRLMEHAGQSNGKPLMLECGGKSPQVVCADMADELDALAGKIVHDAFWNTGQWCAARSRLIVEKDFYEPLLDAVVRASANLIPGDPLDPNTNFGTIASASQYLRIQGYIETGAAEGATFALEGTLGAACATSISPTIFRDVAPGMTIARDEIFGPVLCATVAEDFAEAMILANDTPYGLGATVWTKNALHIQTAIRSTRAGKLTIRTNTAAAGGSGHALAAEPAGASGFGIERGMEGLRSYCRTRAVEVL